MRYLYINISERHDAKRIIMERVYCGVRVSKIASVVGCPPATIYRWQQYGVTTTTSSTLSYLRIVRGIHQHSSLDYMPCPTMVRLAPEKWTIRKLVELQEIRRYHAK